MEYDKNLYTSLESIAEKYNDLNNQIENSNVDFNQLKEINKAIKHTKPIYEKFLTYKKMIENAVQDEKVLDSNSDADLIELAKMELDDIKTQIPSIESELKIMLIPRDPNNDKNVIVEMRPGVGGDESCIFVADLFDTSTHMVMTTSSLASKVMKYIQNLNLNQVFTVYKEFPQLKLKVEYIHQQSL